jgi:hypothetical protein
MTQMLLNIPYMGHMGYNMNIAPIHSVPAPQQAHQPRRGGGLRRRGAGRHFDGRRLLRRAGAAIHGEFMGDPWDFMVI